MKTRSPAKKKKREKSIKKSARMPRTTIYGLERLNEEDEEVYRKLHRACADPV